MMDDKCDWLDEILARDATKQSRGFAQSVDPTERQVGGGHYLKMPIQPLEFSMANGLNACQHTAIKYIVRRKGDRLQDIDKAIHTLEIYREMIRNGEAE